MSDRVPSRLNTSTFGPIQPRRMLMYAISSVRPKLLAALVATMLLSLHCHGAEGDVRVHVHPNKLVREDKLSDGKEGDAIELDGETLLVWVDLQPKAKFAHPTQYVLVSTKGTRTIKGMWWPVLNGADLFRSEKPYELTFPILLEGAPADKPTSLPSRIAAQSVYLQTPVEIFHKVTVIGDLDGKGTLILDPNECQINEFGDREACTEIQSIIIPILIKDTKKADQLNIGRRLFSLESPKLRNRWLLVVHQDKHRPARLVFNDRGPGTPRPISLEPLVYGERHGAGQVELCSATSYSAQQVPGSVLIFASGMHPTNGYTTYFQQLPPDVYPPEFNLMHTKPDAQAGDIIAPFIVYTAFPAKQKVEKVTVYDAKGKHEVAVEQVPDIK
jgi:hypothetical protein